MSISDEVMLCPGFGTSTFAQLKGLLFPSGTVGPMFIPGHPDMIAANTLGATVATLIDFSGNSKNATQGTDANRGIYGRVPKSGRRNLLTYSEDFSNDIWVKTVSVSSNVSNDPAGVATIDRLTDSGVGFLFASQDITGVATNTAYVFSFLLAKDNDETRFPEFGLDFSGGSAVTNRHFVNTKTGATVARAGLAAGTIAVSSYSDSFWLVEVKTTSGAGSTTAKVLITPAANSVIGTMDTNALGSINIGWAQFEAGTARGTYQKVVSAYDVTESGQADCYYVQPDGVDDGYATSAINYSGLDVVSAFFGLRRLSDAARGTVCELTTSIASNNGAFHLTAPNAASATYAFESKGTILTDAVATSALATAGRVVTASGDISGNLSRIQIDNNAAVENTGDQGTGNYSNAVLYLFRRGGTTLPANLQMFFGALPGRSYDRDFTAGQISQIKSLISRLTPGVTL